MRVVPSLLAAAALVLGTSASSTAFEPPVVVPGGTWEREVYLSNYTDEPRTVHARVRARGHRYWGTPRQRAVRGEWVALPPVHLGPGEAAAVPVSIPLPETTPVVLTMEIRRRDGRRSPLANSYETAFLEEPEDPPPAPAGGEIPFRLVAGGFCGHPPLDPGQTTGDVARDDAEWEALRSHLEFLPPVSWGLPIGNGYDHGYYGDGRSPFASASPPDLGTETLLAVYAFGGPEYSVPRQFVVRSIRQRRDGTVVCQFSERYRRLSPRGGYFLISAEPSFLLVAIPKSDAPIEFRRVP